MKKTMIISVMILLLGVQLVMQVAGRQEEIRSPDEVIKVLEDAVQKAVDDGEYRCCIQPACTMCYLGNWKFEKGHCYCDDAIVEGRDGDVCPQCKKALETNECSSVKEAADAHIGAES